ncbi:13521_t:CDS:1, partial [Cetraspora pellucida]
DDIQLTDEVITTPKYNHLSLRCYTKSNGDENDDEKGDEKDDENNVRKETCRVRIETRVN